MSALGIILGLVPLALFSFLANWIPVGWAGLIGVVAALIAMLADLRGGVKLLPAAAVGILAVITVVAFTGGPDTASFLGDFGRSIATFAMALIILATSWTAPFTAAYARQTVPREYWGNARFRAGTQNTSILWGVIILIMGFSHFIAELLDLGGVTGGILPLLLNWGVPIAAIVIGVRMTKQITDGPDGSAGPGSASPADAPGGPDRTA
jgi:hypothetical protein